MSRPGARAPGEGPADSTRLGHLLGPHGVQGGVKLYVLGDPAQVMALTRVYVTGRGWLRLRRTDALAPGVVLHLAGFATREDAEAVRGAEVYAADAELPALEEGSYYYHDLRGLPLVAPDGEVLGEVRDVFDGGHQDLLVVTHPGGEAFLPLQAPYVLIENAEGRPVRVRLAEDAPEGLLGDPEESGLGAGEAAPEREA
ncbi:ribosome maturation factor RimM [Deinococcus sp. Leaf326]|uniref:ribosome maturation factor RimM n=1 Tax=Deinococcus sp. Leaf326 TaxID=1736338 RepID=UPI0006F91863|nr:ribosome maturation factor RimM [Deinococcus sp. Leaf326]KQR40642.1 ribosome maturation factor RimM [Deinococcus sp. Leaf326]